MTTTITVRSTDEDIDNLFENSSHLSIRYFNRIGEDKYEVVIRHINAPDVTKMINRAKTCEDLLEIENYIARESI